MNDSFPAIPIVTSSQAAWMVTLLAVATCCAFCVVARRKTGRVALPLLACASWAALIAGGHAASPCCWMPCCVLIGNVSAVTSFVHWRGRWTQRLEIALGVFVLAILLSVVQVISLSSLESILSPWRGNQRRGTAVVLSLENGYSETLAMAWQSDGDPTATAWMTVTPGSAAREWHLLDSISFGSPIEGTLLVRAGDGEPVGIRVAEEPYAHLRVRVDGHGEVLLRIGADGCLGAPAFGDERAVGVVPSER